ncbi:MULTISPECIES: TerC family protein [unclassified Massilia]|uniref:TerC family protein n=1 Tax=unclassified Massilia TaxID=2609279 RepID=UPI001B8450F1|nr:MULTISPECIES: TerC family protein [unclassified Massilia]MBQ5941211.1 TerC family protein [Massilia sp. AB1]MBQ5965518.1 TerC family protein [Massilia sp. ZL223]
MDLLYTVWLGAPVWMWASFVAIVVALLAFDLGVLNKDDHVIGVRESLKLSALYIAAGLAFGLWVWHAFGSEKALHFYTGFLIEKSLSLDNIFVISLIFATLAIPAAYQHRVLFWGILGVILTRGIMIGAGSALVASYYWVLYIFGAILVITGIKMFFASDNPDQIRDSAVLKWLKGRLRMTEGMRGNAFLVREPDPARPGHTLLLATPLFLALCMVEITDVIFAVDSVPAIFAITSDPFIVYTSNIFAVLGLRALYFALAAMVERFTYLKYSLAAVLVFIGSKIFLGDFVFDGKVPASLSLAVTAVLIAAGIGYSLWRTRSGLDDRAA